MRSRFWSDWREAASPRSCEVCEAHVEGAPSQRFGRVGEVERESESDCEAGIMRSGVSRGGEGEGEDIVWPWSW